MSDLCDVCFVLCSAPSLPAVFSLCMRAAVQVLVMKAPTGPCTSSACLHAHGRVAALCTRPHILSPSQLHLPRVSTTARVLSSGDEYSFAKVEPRMTGRKVRGRDRRQALELKDLVDGLCSMTEKQLKAVIPICGQELVDGVRVAAALPRPNQGRKRQESYLVKLLRTQLDEAAVLKLQGAVELARTSSTSYVDASVSEQVEEWREGLRESNKDTMTVVLSRLASLRTQQQPSSTADMYDDSDSGYEWTEGSQSDSADSDGSSSSSGGVSSSSSEGGGKPLPTPQEFRTLVRQWRSALEEAQAARDLAQVAAQGSAGPVLSDGGENVESIVRASSQGLSISRTDAAAAAEAATRRSRKLAKKLNTLLKQLAQGA